MKGIKSGDIVLDYSKIQSKLDKPAPTYVKNTIEQILWNPKNEAVLKKHGIVDVGISAPKSVPVDRMEVFNKNKKFDCISSMFAIHYLFDSQPSIDNLIYNVKNFLKTDGYLICTLFDPKQVLNLLTEPNNFQNQYEFWYQWLMWHELLGEAFTLWWRKDQGNPTQTPLEMYILDSTLIAVTITDTRYPSYRLSTPSYGFAKDQELAAHQIMHIKEMGWQGSSGFNKGVLMAELVGLDQDIDLYANYVMQNGAKPSGLFRTDQVIPDAKYKEIAARLKEAWASMTGSKSTDLSKPGQGMLLDQGMTFETVKMLTLQDADAARLKEQTTNRICALFGVPPQMLGLATGKYNNTQTLLDEFYKTTMYPIIVNIEQKFRQQLLKGYPNLYIRFDTKDFLKGAALDQMNFVSAGIASGILTIIRRELRSFPASIRAT